MPSAGWSRSRSRRNRTVPGPDSRSAQNANGPSTTTPKTTRPPGAAPSAAQGYVPGATASATAASLLPTPPLVSLGATVSQGGKLLAEAIEVVEVEGGERVPITVGALGQNCAPRVDDDGSSVGPPSVGLLPPLGRRYDVGLVLHGPRPQQKLPVILARLEREGGWHGQNLGAA